MVFSDQDICLFASLTNLAPGLIGSFIQQLVLPISFTAFRREHIHLRGFYTPVGFCKLHLGRDGSGVYWIDSVGDGRGALRELVSGV